MAEWRTVPEWPNYEVSNDGQVRVKGKKAPKRTWLNTNGYETTQLSSKGYKRAFYIHRLVAQAFVKAVMNRSTTSTETAAIIGQKTLNGLT